MNLWTTEPQMNLWTMNYEAFQSFSSIATEAQDEALNSEHLGTSSFDDELLECHSLYQLQLRSYSSAGIVPIMASWCPLVRFVGL